MRQEDRIVGCIGGTGDCGGERHRAGIDQDVVCAGPDYSDAQRELTAVLDRDGVSLVRIDVDGHVADEATAAQGQDGGLVCRHHARHHRLTLEIGRNVVRERDRLRAALKVIRIALRIVGAGTHDDRSGVSSGSQRGRIGGSDRDFAGALAGDEWRADVDQLGTVDLNDDVQSAADRPLHCGGELRGSWGCRAVPRPSRREGQLIRRERDRGRRRLRRVAATTATATSCKRQATNPSTRAVLILAFIVVSPNGERLISCMGRRPAHDKAFAANAKCELQHCRNRPVLHSLDGTPGPADGLLQSMDKFRRCLFLLFAALAFALPPLTAAADESPFVRPAELEHDIAFWRRVYTEVTTEGGLLHDPGRPERRLRGHEAAQRPFVAPAPEAHRGHEEEVRAHPRPARRRRNRPERRGAARAGPVAGSHTSFSLRASRGRRALPARSVRSVPRRHRPLGRVARAHRRDVHEDGLAEASSRRSRTSRAPSIRMLIRRSAPPACGSSCAAPAGASCASTRSSTSGSIRIAPPRPQHGSSNRTTSCSAAGRSR